MDSILEFLGLRDKNQKIPKKHKIIVWTLKGCSNCILLKEYLNKNNWDYTEKPIKKNMKELEKLVLKHGIKSKTAPVVFIDGNYIGGSRETLKFLKNLKN